MWTINFGDEDRTGKMDYQKSQTISASELIEIIRRRKTTLIVSVMLALLLVFSYNRLATKFYEASSIIVFENYSKNTIVDFEIAKTFSWASFVANRVQEMQTEAFAQQLYEELSEAESSLFRL